MKWDIHNCSGYDAWIEFIITDNMDQQSWLACVKFDGCVQMGERNQETGQIIRWHHICNLDEEIEKLVSLKKAIKESGFEIG